MIVRAAERRDCHQAAVTSMQCLPPIDVQRATSARVQRAGPNTHCSDAQINGSLHTHPETSIR